jgi:CheY-like chemotaxis protein
MGATIHLIDDDGDVTGMLSLLLRRAGYDSINEFSHPLDAFGHILRCGLPALVITDYQMPDISGVDLLDELTLLFGAVNAIIITGNPEDVRDIVGGNYPIIGKGSRDFCTRLLETVGERLTGELDPPHITVRRSFEAIDERTHETNSFTNPAFRFRNCDPQISLTGDRFSRPPQPLRQARNRASRT